MPLTGYKTRRYSGPADYSQVKQKIKRINSLGSRINLLGLHTGSATSCKTLDKSYDFSLPQLPSPVWTHISFSLSHFPPAPPFSPSPPPTTTAASLDPFRIADILSALHTSLRPQQPSLMDWRGGGGPQLGKMVGNRVEVGK